MTSSFGHSLADLPAEKWTTVHGLRVPTFVGGGHHRSLSSRAHSVGLIRFLVGSVLYTIVTLMDKKHAWDQEGLYRVPGAAARVARAKTALDTNQPLSGMHSINDIASLHKTFLREMPEGLLAPLKGAFEQAARLPPSAVPEALALLLQLLPAASRDVLLFQLPLWARVVEHAAANRMDSRNLALMLAPNVFHSPQDDARAFADDFAPADAQDSLTLSLQLLVEHTGSLRCVPALPFFILMFML